MKNSKIQYYRIRREFEKQYGITRFKYLCYVPKKLYPDGYKVFKGLWGGAPPMEMNWFDDMHFAKMTFLDMYRRVYMPEMALLKLQGEFR